MKEAIKKGPWSFEREMLRKVRHLEEEGEGKVDPRREIILGPLS